jgi:hypothetical protein
MHNPIMQQSITRIVTKCVIFWDVILKYTNTFQDYDAASSGSKSKSSKQESSKEQAPKCWQISATIHRLITMKMLHESAIQNRRVRYMGRDRKRTAGQRDRLQNRPANQNSDTLQTGCVSGRIWDPHSSPLQNFEIKSDEIKLVFWKNMKPSSSGLKNILVSCLPYSLALKIKGICSSKMSVCLSTDYTTLYPSRNNS